MNKLTQTLLIDFHDHGVIRSHRFSAIWLVIYYMTAHTLALVATVLYKLFSR